MFHVVRTDDSDTFNHKIIDFACLLTAAEFGFATFQSYQLSEYLHQRAASGCDVSVVWVLQSLASVTWSPPISIME